MKENTKRLLDALDYNQSMAESYDHMMEASKRMVPEYLLDNPSFVTFLAVYREESLRRFPIEMGRVLEEAFSDEEMNALITIYESDVYKKHIGLLPKLLQVSHDLALDIIRDIQGKMMGQFGPGHMSN